MVLAYVHYSTVNRVLALFYFGLRPEVRAMNIENKGQYPSFGVFVKLVSMFDISVDQFIHSDSGNKESLCRKHIDVLLNTMNEKELVFFNQNLKRFLH